MNQLITPSQVPVSVLDAGVLGSLSAQMSKQLFWGTRPSCEHLSEELLILLACSERRDIEPEFNELTRKWKSERKSTSSTTTIAMHPAYQQIIGMGKSALPLILRELEKELDHWFWALRAIAGEDPVPEEHRGKMKQMATDWLQWGREQGYAQ
jgi:hypothetical protein